MKKIITSVLVGALCEIIVLGLDRIALVHLADSTSGLVRTFGMLIYAVGYFTILPGYVLLESLGFSPEKPYLMAGAFLSAALGWASVAWVVFSIRAGSPESNHSPEPTAKPAAH